MPNITTEMMLTQAIQVFQAVSHLKSVHSNAAASKRAAQGWSFISFLVFLHFRPSALCPQAPMRRLWACKQVNRLPGWALVADFPNHWGPSVASPTFGDETCATIPRDLRAYYITPGLRFQVEELSSIRSTLTRPLSVSPHAEPK